MAEKPMYAVSDVKKILQVQSSKAYEIIRTLNKELEEQGFLTVKGKVSAKYFNERFFGNTD